MQALKLIAGATAKKRIEEKGLTPDLVRMVLGASGGPKWLVLSGLDQALFGDWLSRSSGEIALIGSSIGAWRMAAAAHPDAKRITAKFLEEYLEFPYERDFKARDITRESYNFLDRVWSGDDIQAVLNNKKRPLHIVAVKCKGLAASKNGLALGLGILAAAGANLISTRSLSIFFDRAVFYSGHQVCLSDQWCDYDRVDIPLETGNIADALMASGSIPLVIDEIEHINGAPEGIYRDGGVIDYHFARPWRLEDGIIMYPHFYPYLVPGWFDKKLRRRRGGPGVLDQMLLLSPTYEFVNNLPYAEIPSRKDFGRMENFERKKYWNHVIDKSKYLADEFMALTENHSILMDRLDGPENA